MHTSNESFIRRGTLIIAALCLSFSLVLIGLNATISHAQSNSLVVTSLDGSTNGVCPDANNCTLGAALAQAAQSTSATTITFGLSGTITPINGFEIVLVNGAVSPGITIDGSGQTIFLDGGGHSALFQLVGNSSPVTLNHLIIQNSEGPAIRVVTGNLTIANSQIIKNAGTGLLNNFGNVLVQNSLFTENKGANGAAIQSMGGHMTIANSIIDGNQSVDNAGGLYANDRTVVLVSSVIAQNTAVSGPDISGNVISLGHNLIGVADASSLSPSYGMTATAIQSVFAANAGTAIGVQNMIKSMTPNGYQTPTATITPTGFTATVTPTQPPIMQNNGSDQIGTSAAPIDPLLTIQQPTGNSGMTLTVQSGSPLLGKGLCTGVSSVYPAVPAISTDLKGTPRGNPCTIGAYEH